MPHEPIQMSLVEIPILNVIDLTKRSENLARLNKGQIRSIEDFQSEIVIDNQLNVKDLAVVEEEVNKKLRKKH